MPSPKNMNANRFGGAVRAGWSLAMAVSDSSHGKATVAPRPFKTTRRVKCCVLIDSPPRKLRYAIAIVSRQMAFVHHFHHRLLSEIGISRSRPSQECDYFSVQRPLEAVKA